MLSPIVATYSRSHLCQILANLDVLLVNEIHPLLPVTYVEKLLWPLALKVSVLPFLDLYHPTKKLTILHADLPMSFVILF